MKAQAESDGDGIASGSISYDGARWARGGVRADTGTMACLYPRRNVNDGVRGLAPKLTDRRRRVSHLIE